MAYNKVPRPGFFLKNQVDHPGPDKYALHHQINKPKP